MQSVLSLKDRLLESVETLSSQDLLSTFSVSELRNIARSSGTPSVKQFHTYVEIIRRSNMRTGVTIWVAGLGSCSLFHRFDEESGWHTYLQHRSHGQRYEVHVGLTFYFDWLSLERKKGVLRSKVGVVI